MHWQIRAWDGTVSYLDPQKYQIEMTGCILINKKNAAKKVHAAGKKDVCGWVECDNFFINEKGSIPIDNLERLCYNPIVEPSWRRVNDDGDFDWDDYDFNSLVTDGNRIHIVEERCYA
jgi:hypothetical protein